LIIFNNFNSASVENTGAKSEVRYKDLFFGVPCSGLI